MHEDRRLSNVPRVSELHPVVYKALAGCVVWSVAALWVLFSREPEMTLQLAVVTAFAAAFVGIPLWLRHLSMTQPASKHLPFAEWSNARFEIVGGTIAAGEAALLVLLAPLSCAIGLTAISIIRLFVVHGS